MDDGRNPSDIHGPRILTLAPQYRRIGVYLLLGFLASLGTTVGLELAGLGHGWGHAALGAVVLGALTLGPALVVLRQLLRVDLDGVSRRRFLSWDLWSWEAFATGQIQQGPALDSFVDPKKPVWRRHLFLEFLADEDRAWL